MQANETDHQKKFQIERIALFSDAVFAIAITLLIIEVKVPEVESPVTDGKIWEALQRMIPRLIGFVVSFYVVGLYWMVHHRMFGHVVNYTRRLLRINLLFLFSIVLMPFSSAFYSDYFITYTRIPMAVYVGNICLSGLISYRMWRMLSRPQNGLSIGLEKGFMQRYHMIRSLMVPATFLLIFLVSLVFRQFAFFITMLVPLINLWVVSYFRKKHPADFTP